MAVFGQHACLPQTKFVSVGLVVERHGDLEMIIQKASESRGKRRLALVSSRNEEYEVVLLHNVSARKGEFVWHLMVHVHNVVFVVCNVCLWARVDDNVRRRSWR